MRATTAARPASTRPDESVSSKPNGPRSLLRKLRSTTALSSSSRSGSAGSTVPRFDASRLRSATTVSTCFESSMDSGARQYAQTASVSTLTGAPQLEQLPAARARYGRGQRAALAGTVVIDDDEEVEHPVRRQREIFEIVEPERRAEVADVQLERLPVFRVELLLGHLLMAARTVHR